MNEHTSSDRPKIKSAILNEALEALETSKPMMRTAEAMKRHEDAIRALKAEVKEQAPVDKDATTEPHIVWSTNEEDFREGSLGELLDHFDDLEPGSTVYFGNAVYPTTNQLCDADDIIEMIGERAYDFGGEYAEDFPNVSQEATDELQSFIAGWISKHCVPTFYQVEKIQQRVLTADDFDADDERLQSQPQQVNK